MHSLTRSIPQLLLFVSVMLVTISLFRLGMQSRRRKANVNHQLSSVDSNYSSTHLVRLRAFLFENRRLLSQVLILGRKDQWNSSEEKILKNMQRNYQSNELRTVFKSNSFLSALHSLMHALAMGCSPRPFLSHFESVAILTVD